MSSHHLVKGSSLPAANPELLRIYSMRFCPFAQRTRLVAAHKRISHEIVNINLRNKPEWVFDLNPFGTVPIVQYKYHVIYDSAVTSQLMEEAFPGTESEALLPADPFLRAEIKLFMALCDNKTMPIFAILSTPTAEKREEERVNFIKSAQFFEDHLVEAGKPFFGGEHVGMVDLHIWPFFERVPVAKAIFEMDLLPAETFPHLSAWLVAMKNIYAVKYCEVSVENYQEFFESSNKGEPQYDLELESRHPSTCHQPHHLARGSSKPAVDTDVLRLYSMRFCPYAQRSRLAATFKNIPYEEVNVNLRDKPEWLFDLNPSGLVPILEYKGHVIYESSVINQYLEEAYPGTESEALLPADPFERAEIKLFMALSDTKVKLIYQVAMNTDEKRVDALLEWFKGLQVFEDYLAKTGGPFFGGAHIGMLDLHIWPFFERTPAVGAIAGVDMEPQSDSHPHLITWIAAMENSNTVEKILLPFDLHKRFMESMLAGNAQYDLE